MPKVTFQPSGKTIKARIGQSLLSAARSARVTITQRCDGNAACLMCKVMVEEGAVSVPSEFEARKVGEKDLALGWRLSCQAKVQNVDCVIKVPENRLKSVVAQALERQKREEEEF